MNPQIYAPKQGCIFDQVETTFLNRNELICMCKCSLCNPFGGLTSFISVITEAYSPHSGCIFKQFDFHVPRLSALVSACMCSSCNGIPKFNILEHYRSVYVRGPICFKQMFPQPVIVTDLGWNQICKEICTCETCLVFCGR